jgi:hypothetical protein
MASVAPPRSSGKSDPSARFKALSLLDGEAVEQVCRELGYEWAEGGKLPPGKTLECFAWQVTMGNQSLEAVAQHRRADFSAEAYCKARQRLPLEVMGEYARRVAGHAMGAMGEDRRGEGLYRGRRVFRIDGTGISLPDSPAVRGYFGCSGRQKPGCGYPTAHLLVLTGPGGVAREVICSPLRTGDMTCAAQTHVHLEAGDVLLGDGLFGGWGHFHHLSGQKPEGLFPAHHSRKIGRGQNADHGKNRRFVKALGYFDQLVEYRKPAARPEWMGAKEFKDAPQWIAVREIRREVKVGGVRRMITVVTTLTDPQAHPAKELVRLLGERWAIEVDLRSLKTTMGMEKLKCQSVEGVRKELLMYLIVYNLVKLLMAEAARRQDVPLSRLSFASALAALRYGDGSVVVIKLLPLRPGRTEPRVVKRRPKHFPTMSKPRDVLRKLLLEKRKKAAGRG